MRSDFQTYVDCNATSEPFEHVWVTNEFDAARLLANATATAHNANLFTVIVHVNPDAVRVVHRLHDDGQRAGLVALNDALARRRIIGLGEWLGSL